MFPLPRIQSKSSIPVGLVQLHVPFSKSQLPEKVQNKLSKYYFQQNLFLVLANRYSVTLVSMTIHCIKSMLHAFNSHVSTGTNPYINNAIPMLFTHGFDTFDQKVSKIFFKLP